MIALFYCQKVNLSLPLEGCDPWNSFLPFIWQTLSPSSLWQPRIHLLWGSSTDSG